MDYKDYEILLPTCMIIDPLNNIDEASNEHDLDFNILWKLKTYSINLRENLATFYRTMEDFIKEDGENINKLLQQNIITSFALHILDLKNEEEFEIALKLIYQLFTINEETSLALFQFGIPNFLLKQIKSLQISLQNSALNCIYIIAGQSAQCCEHLIISSFLPELMNVLVEQIKEGRIEKSIFVIKILLKLIPHIKLNQDLWITVDFAISLLSVESLTKYSLKLLNSASKEFRLPLFTRPSLFRTIASFATSKDAQISNLAIEFLTIRSLYEPDFVKNSGIENMLLDIPINDDLALLVLKLLNNTGINFDIFNKIYGALQKILSKGEYEDKRFVMNSFLDIFMNSTVEVREVIVLEYTDLLERVLLSISMPDDVSQSKVLIVLSAIADVNTFLFKKLLDESELLDSIDIISNGTNRALSLIASDLLALLQR